MNTFPSQKRIQDIVKRRFIDVNQEVKAFFPDILKVKNINWISLGNEYILALIFINDTDIQRINSYQLQKFEPFPGLFTIEEKKPSAFRFENSRFTRLQDCSVNNMNSFSIGRDSSFYISNHTHSIDTKELGKISYCIPLGYFISFGNEITYNNAYENLEDLFAYSIKTWRDSHEK